MITRVLSFSFLLMSSNAALAQAATATPSLPGPTSPQLEVDQVSGILGLTANVQRLRTLQAGDGCDFVVASPEELTLREHLLESVQTASLDLDGVMGTIANERGQLGNLQTSLKASRDKTVAKLTASSLITGSGVGAAVSATQFITVGSRTNNVGDGIGIGSGAASTLLAYLAIKKQHGPEGTVQDVPNMLAPLFNRPPVLNTSYPPIVLQYLGSAPPGKAAERGTRLEQLKAEWGASGRLDSSGTEKEQKKITVLTASAEKDVKISIDDLTDRIAMLGDVSGRISLMKRDLALLMRSYTVNPACSTNEVDAGKR